MEKEIFIVSTGEEIKRLRRRLDQDEEILEHKFNLFLNWFSCQKHLPQNVDRNCLRNFVNNCKGDLEKAKKKILCYFYSRSTLKEFVGDRVNTLEADLRSLEYVYTLALPKVTPEGRRIYILKVYNMNIFELMPAARYFTIFIDYVLHREHVLAGQIAVIDLEGLKPSHYSKIFSTELFKFIRLLFNMYPQRIKQIIIVSCHPYLEKGINLCKSLLPQKIANRFTMIADPNELQKLIPTSCLPSDYGGSLKSLKELCGLWQKELMENKDFLVSLSQNVPTGPVPKEFVHLENEFGVNGSFRKLNID